jgi:hypothetical protein
VRSEVLGRARFRHLDLVVDADNGVVHLRGSAPPEVARELVDTIVGLEGVAGVEDLLHRPGEPAPNKAAALNASSSTRKRTIVDVEPKGSPADIADQSRPL